MAMLYFAYGSNMNHKQMAERCPGSCFVKRVYLEGYKFIYDGYSNTRKGAVANIIEENGNIVWGGLFEIKEDDLRSLDRYEGYPKSYDRKIEKLIDGVGDVYDAWIYFRIGQKQGQPSEDYRNIVIKGAYDCNLYQEYIRNNL